MLVMPSNLTSVSLRGPGARRLVLLSLPVPPLIPLSGAREIGYALDVVSPNLKVAARLIPHAAEPLLRLLWPPTLLTACGKAVLVSPARCSP